MSEHKISLGQQIEEAEECLWAPIQIGKATRLSEKEMDYRRERRRAVIETLRWLQANETAVRAFVEAKADMRTSMREVSPAEILEAVRQADQDRRDQKITDDIENEQRRKFLRECGEVSSRSLLNMERLEDIPYLLPCVVPPCGSDVWDEGLAILRARRDEARKLLKGG